MIDMSNKEIAKKSIDAYGANLLPRHTKGHEKYHLETTYKKDYIHHNPHLIDAPKPEEEVKLENYKILTNL